MGGRVFWLFNFGRTATTTLSNLSFVGGRCKTRMTIQKYDFMSDFSITKN